LVPPKIGGHRFAAGKMGMVTQPEENLDGEMKIFNLIISSGTTRGLKKLLEAAFWNKASSF